MGKELLHWRSAWPLRNAFSKILFEDILAEGKFNVSEIFKYAELCYYNVTDEITKSTVNSFGLTELMVDTKLAYPSSKLTFSIANLSKEKVIRYIDIQLILNGKTDIFTVLEDSKRNFLNSF